VHAIKFCWMLVDNYTICFVNDNQLQKIIKSLTDKKANTFFIDKIVCCTFTVLTSLISTYSVCNLNYKRYNNINEEFFK